MLLYSSVNLFTRMELIMAFCNNYLHTSLIKIELLSPLILSLSQAKPERDGRFIRILIMIVTNVSLNTTKNVDSRGTIRLITFSKVGPKSQVSSPKSLVQLFVLIFIFHIIISQLCLSLFTVNDLRGYCSVSDNNKLDLKMMTAGPGRM